MLREAPSLWVEVWLDGLYLGVELAGPGERRGATQEDHPLRPLDEGRRGLVAGGLEVLEHVALILTKKKK